MGFSGALEAYYSNNGGGVVWGGGEMREEGRGKLVFP